MQYKRKLFENLRFGDLKTYVSEIFTVDKYQSKMGEDTDVLVLGFRVKEKYPALDLMEFVEKSFKFILDADMSAGEERDGHYQVFVEIERTPNLQSQLNELIEGLTNLCDCSEWKFKYQKSNKIHAFNEQSILENIPFTSAAYNQKMLEIKTNDLREFFDKGAVALTLDENNTITFSRPFAGNLQAKFLKIGKSKDVEKMVPGPLSLDESSQSQVIFLSKYLGNYEIEKIGNNFLIKNGNKSVVIEKDRW